MRKQVENTESLLSSLNRANNRTGYLPDLDRAYASVEKVEQSLEEFTASRDAISGASTTDRDLDALCSLATLLRTGAKGVKANTSRAMQLYARAVDGGHVDSMIRLAMLLEEGGE